MKQFSMVPQQLLLVLMLSVAIYIIVPTGCHADTGGFKIKSTGTGSIDHAVTVESSGQFRLLFEAAYNYGLSKWFDLVNDHYAKNNITRNITSYIPDHAQGALFNQVIFPGDLIAHIISAKKYLENEEREIKIVESNSLRVVINCSYHPMIGEKVNRHIQLITRYVIYPTGKIYIKNTLQGVAHQEIKEWRNSIMGLGDPSYMTTSEAGENLVITERELSDLSKNWQTDQWAGCRLNQPGYNAWEIASNSSTTLRLGKRISGTAPLCNGEYTIGSRHDKYGWIRATDRQNPYQWHKEKAKYLFMYWDPETPPPFTNWTRASILLVPHPDNPYQGKQSHHEWQGFKRFYYQSGPITLDKNDRIVQRYLIQLGTQNSGILPDIKDSKVADNYADDYLHPAHIKIHKGLERESAYDPSEGCYTLKAKSGILSFAIDGSTIKRIKPVFKVLDYPGEKLPVISINGVPQKLDLDYLAHVSSTGVLLVQLLKDVDTNTRIDMANEPASKSIVSHAEIKDIELATSTETAITSDPLLDERSPGRNTPRLRSAILPYTKYPDSVARWINERFALQVGGRQRPGTGVQWLGYVDIYGVGSLAEYLEMKEFAARNKLSYEGMLLHALKDYSPKTRPAFREMDKFDVFEGKNGILKTRDHRYFEDLTARAYNGRVDLSDTIYISYEEPFAEVNMNFAKPGKQVTSHAEYWNGKTWKSLSVHDGTNGFAMDGRLTFMPPADWAVTGVNGSRAKYFIRILFTGARQFPVTQRIFGDSWINPDGKSCRGWESHDEHIINSGPLTFNPSPPQAATAFFPYQARICSWGPGHFVANPADVQQIDGQPKRPWASYVAERMLTSAKMSGYQGIMCDDGERDVAWDAIDSGATDFVAKSARSWRDESSAKYAEITSNVKNSDALLLIGINAQGRGIALHGDWTLAEYHTFVWKTGSPRNISRTDNTKVLTYDDYLPANNPRGVFGLLMYQDTTDVVPNTNAPWDRANRGPLAALSKHYIGMNENTVFSYYSRGGFIYDETDEVFLKNGKFLRQSTDPIPPIEAVKRWATYFPAMGVDVGISDTSGHNGGQRDFTWKKGADLGGGPDIWRRDFTNAVVLHRPAYYNTTKDEYEKYSDHVRLGRNFYPLRADGITGPAIDNIALRAGEGAILMKYPIDTVHH